MDKTGRKLATSIFSAGRMIVRQMIHYSTTGDSYQVEWKNQDSFALSDLRTRKHASSPNIDGAQYAPMELDPAGTELSGLMPEGGGGIDPEIPELDPNGGGVDGQYYTGDPGYYRRGLGGSGSPGCAINGSLIDCSRIRYADGYGNGIFSSLERAVRESVRQTGTRLRVRELVDKKASGRPASGQRWGSDGESYLIGYEWWTEPIYSNDWAVIRQTPQDTFSVPSSMKEFRRSVVEIFRNYGQSFRRCVWEIFSKDQEGNPSDIAQVMKTPSSSVVPYEKSPFMKTLWAHKVLLEGTPEI